MYNIQYQILKKPSQLNPSHILMRADNVHFSKNTQNSNYFYHPIKPSSTTSFRKLSLGTKASLNKSSCGYVEIENRNTIPTEQQELPKALIQQLSNKMQKMSKQIQNHNYKLKVIENQINSEYLVQRTVSSIKNSNILQQVIKIGQINNQNSFNEIYDHLFNIKLQIQNIKQQLTKGSKKRYTDNETMSFNQKIKQQVKNHKTQVNNIVSQLQKKIQNGLLTYQNEIVNQIQLNKLKQDVSLIKNKLNNTKNIKIGNQKFFGNPISYKYQQIIKINQQKELISNQEIYYVDLQGKLLDKNHFYIIDQNQMHVKIQDHHVQILKMYKVIQEKPKFMQNSLFKEFQ